MRRAKSISHARQSEVTKLRTMSESETAGDGFPGEESQGKGGIRVIVIQILVEVFQIVCVLAVIIARRIIVAALVLC